MEGHVRQCGVWKREKVWIVDASRSEGAVGDESLRGLKRPVVDGGGPSDVVHALIGGVSPSAL